MLEEMGTPYETEVFMREHNLAPPSLKKIHPLGKAPVITDGDLVIAESGAIIEYLAEKYGKETMIPAGGFDSQAVLDYKYWLHYAEGSLMPPLVMQLIFNRIKTSKMPFFVKPIAKGIVQKVEESYLGPNISTHMGFVDDYLSKNEWFAGDSISAADVQMLFPLEASVNQKGFAAQYPNIAAYVKRLQARPAYQRALDAGEPYAFAGKS